MVNGTGGNHQAWVEGTARDAAERVPCSCEVERLDMLIDVQGNAMHILSSNQSQKSAKPCSMRYFVALKLNQGSTVQWLS